MKKIVIYILIGLSGPLMAQDVHFSQFDRNPLQLNPALTGQMDGWFRSNIHYNNQWAALGVAYRTLSFSVDAPLFKGKEGAYLGTGINVVRDKAGDSQYGFTNAGVSVSGILPIGEQSELSLGFRGAFVQRTMSQANLQWDSQFDGTGYNAALPGEGLSGGAFHYFDYNTGLNYRFDAGNSTLSSNDRLYFDVGGSYNHITRPGLFFGKGDRLPYRISAYAFGSVGIASTRLDILPQFLYSMQGRQIEILAGTYVKYRIVEDSRSTGFVRRSSVAFGAVYRVGDALAPGFQYEIADFTIRASYDINLSSLSRFTTGRGGPEISIVYVDHLGSLTGRGSTHRSLF